MPRDTHLNFFTKEKIGQMCLQILDNVNYPESVNTAVDQTLDKNGFNSNLFIKLRSKFREYLRTNSFMACIKCGDRIRCQSGVVLPVTGRFICYRCLPDFDFEEFNKKNNR